MTRTIRAAAAAGSIVSANTRARSLTSQFFHGVRWGVVMSASTRILAGPPSTLPRRPRSPEKSLASLSTVATHPRAAD